MSEPKSPENSSDTDSLLSPLQRRIKREYDSIAAVKWLTV